MLKSKFATPSIVKENLMMVGEEEKNDSEESSSDEDMPYVYGPSAGFVMKSDKL